MKRIFILLFILFISVSITQAKTKKFGTWMEFEFSKELFEKFEISLIPEIRLEDDFTIDEYLIDVKFTYEPVKFLNFAAAYRINTNVKNKGNEISKRFVLDANAKQEFGRFEASLRTRYTNYTDVEEGESESNYFRPRAKLEYDIKGNKIRPFVSYELFRNTTEKETRKGRFDIGFTRKLGNLHRIGIYYRLQDYFDDSNSVHILGIDYRLKF
ncbi:MAG: DUF2490 domain-containing protein [Prolixibacteraceae bacterium]|jgi:hypothetical protein|nr:DUF2490 domain-containing protein [Prolixibacteraceae bacterium]MBT6763036.1 DUF2490 domain-containing protein [Prolixibacteraceae bacterium]MBT6998425.1 DUF2490 domain-containing protein [Prolixibacteraceae bacterium]MBT7397039.1 DUF2490 domain-containing protein [Prolixibacteraceae bacterium]